MRPKRFCSTAFELQRGVAPVLLDHEEAHAGDVARSHHALAVLPVRRHRLLRDNVLAGLGSPHCLLGVKPARRGKNDDVGVGFLQRSSYFTYPWAPVAASPLQRAFIDIAHTDDFSMLNVFLQRLDMVLPYAAASHEAKRIRRPVLGL